MERKLFVLMEMCFNLDDRSVEDILGDLEQETIKQIEENYELGTYAYMIEVHEGDEYKIVETELLIGREVFQQWLQEVKP